MRPWPRTPIPGLKPNVIQIFNPHSSHPGKKPSHYAMAHERLESRSRTLDEINFIAGSVLEGEELRGSRTNFPVACWLGMSFCRSPRNEAVGHRHTGVFGLRSFCWVSWDWQTLHQANSWILRRYEMTPSRERPLEFGRLPYRNKNEFVALRVARGSCTSPGKVWKAALILRFQKLD